MHLFYEKLTLLLVLLIVTYMDLLIDSFYQSMLFSHALFIAEYIHITTFNIQTTEKLTLIFKNKIISFIIFFCTAVNIKESNYENVIYKYMII